MLVRVDETRVVGGFGRGNSVLVEGDMAIVHFFVYCESSFVT